MESEGVEVRSSKDRWRFAGGMGLEVGELRSLTGVFLGLLRYNVKSSPNKPVHLFCMCCVEVRTNSEALIQCT